MSSIVVTGGRPLTGEVRVGGAKNSALKLMAAALLAPGVSTLAQRARHRRRRASWPRCSSGLGATRRALRPRADDRRDRAHRRYEAPVRDGRADARVHVRARLARRPARPRARGACPAAATSARARSTCTSAGLEALGVEIDVEHGYIDATAPRGLDGAHVSLDFPSVGATENLLMAAALARGHDRHRQRRARAGDRRPRRRSCTAMGARIEGAGTLDHHRSRASTRCTRSSTRVVGDRIEAGTFLVAGALGGGPVTVRGFDPAPPRHRAREARARPACDVERHEDGVTVSRDGPVRPVDVATLPYPGFPTDMQAQFMTLMALADGDCVITENVFENRFMFADELVAHGRRHPHRRPPRARPRRARSSPARRCAAPTCAAARRSCSPGSSPTATTVVTDIHHIERGYEDFVPKLARARRRHPRRWTSDPTAGRPDRRRGRTMLDRDAIKAIIPHREPFLLVDRIDELRARRVAPSATST